VYKPLPSAFQKRIPNSCQIIYTNDAALILLYGGIGPGSKVLEAGTGSGALTSILANYVKPTGHVYSYENRDEAYKTAKKNIQKLDLDTYVTLKLQDATEGFEEKDVDAVVLDLGNPEELIPMAYDSLRPSGTISIFVPTFNQIEKVYSKLRELKFGDIHAMELIQREIQLKPNAIRPNTRMIGHTGFLIFARKLLK
jgi:tRNA (adenine57-N1/adenine58-N1)-methyltransferase